MATLQLRFSRSCRDRSHWTTLAVGQVVRWTTTHRYDRNMWLDELWYLWFSDTQEDHIRKTVVRSVQFSGSRWQQAAETVIYKSLQIQRSLDDGTMGVPHLWRLRLHGGSLEFSMDPPLLDASIFRATIPTGYSTPGNKGRCAENTSETWRTLVGRNIILHICVLEILAIDICLELSLITKSYKPHSFGHKYLRISPSISVTFSTPVTITSR